MYQAILYSFYRLCVVSVCWKLLKNVSTKYIAEFVFLCVCVCEIQVMLMKACNVW